MATGYIHTFSAEEQARLVAQAEFLEPYIFPTIDFSDCARVLEIGCGVGAELQILHRRFPHLQLTGLDSSAEQLAKARDWLPAELSEGWLDLHQGSADELPFSDATFDGVCLIWVLEHLAHPGRALREAKRVLRPGGILSVTEVVNTSWWAEPPCPAMTEYWSAFNTLQRQLGGNPDVGMELGALAGAAGFTELVQRTLPVRMDAQFASSAQRARFISYWRTLWLSAAAQLCERHLVPEQLVDSMLGEFAALASNPAGVFHYAASQLQARKPER